MQALPSVLESCLAAGDHVELVSGQLQGLVQADSYGHAELILELK
jgi:hypothetical protein